jgi:hypothetical protein
MGNGLKAKRNIVSQKQRKRNSGRCGVGTSGYKRLLRFYALRGGASGEFTGVFSRFDDHFWWVPVDGCVVGFSLGDVALWPSI